VFAAFQLDSAFSLVRQIILANGSLQFAYGIPLFLLISIV